MARGTALCPSLPLLSDPAPVCSSARFSLELTPVCSTDTTLSLGRVREVPKRTWEPSPRGQWLPIMRAVRILLRFTRAQGMAGLGFLRTWAPQDDGYDVGSTSRWARWGQTIPPAELGLTTVAAQRWVVGLRAIYKCPAESLLVGPGL